MKERGFQLYWMNMIFFLIFFFKDQIRKRSEEATFLNGIMTQTQPVVVCTQLLLHSALPNLRLTG